MLILLITALTTAYFVVPELLSRFVLDFFIKRKPKNSPRGEELVRAAVWAIFPLIVAWYTRRLGFFVLPAESAAHFQEIFRDIATQSNFDPAFFQSMKLFGLANLSLLARMYTFVVVGSVSLGLVTRNFGRVRDRLRRDSLIAKVLHWAILSQVSEWHAYLSPMFRSDPGNYSIAVDVMTKSDKLYRGEVQGLYLAADGSLQTIILKEAERFLRTDFESELAKFETLPAVAGSVMPSRNDYWRRIPGLGFFILGSDISTVNGRQVSLLSSVDPNEDPELVKVLNDLTDMLKHRKLE